MPSPREPAPRNRGAGSESKALEALSALDPTAERASQIAAIRRALGNTHFRVVARAAAIAEQRSLHEVIAELLVAYGRFLHDPVKRDPKCIAKQAIVRALVELDCQHVDFYLEGIRYVQLEPLWKDNIDTAVDIRCTCAMGLASTGYFRTVAALAPLLADPEARARAGAARAIACANPHEAEVLLRFKALTGDPEAHVIGECFNGLLGIAADHSLTFVADHLSHADPSIQEYAALALGESRHPGAFEQLRAAWDTVCVTREARATLIRAAALHRSDAAFDWLIAIIEREARAHADVAVEALSVYDRNEKLMERMRAALAKRDDR